MKSKEEAEDSYMDIYAGKIVKCVLLNGSTLEGKLETNPRNKGDVKVRMNAHAFIIPVSSIAYLSVEIEENEE